MQESRAKGIWKTLTISGVCLVFIGGLGAFGSIFALRGNVALNSYEGFILAIPVGVVLLLVSLIGWAAVLGRTGRARIAFFTLTIPVAVILIGYLLGGTNVHGPFYYFCCRWPFGFCRPCGCDHGGEYAKSLDIEAMLSE
jgi:hypothetical protein